MSNWDAVMLAIEVAWVCTILAIVALLWSGA